MTTSLCVCAKNVQSGNVAKDRFLSISNTLNLLSLAKTTVTTVSLQVNNHDIKIEIKFLSF